MASETPAPFVIPRIDIGPYLRDPSCPESAQIVQDVKKACMTTGFFSLVGHNVSKELQKRVFKASETIFALPLAEKEKLVPARLRNRGYEIIGSQALQEGTLPDLKEVRSCLGYQTQETADDSC
jgi:isopenicillin N synthase-like dioxygenase